jgi:hypothetical protein
VKKDKDYDSEDPDQYKEIDLFESTENLKKKNMVKSQKKKLDIKSYE